MVDGIFHAESILFLPSFLSLMSLSFLFLSLPRASEVQLRPLLAVSFFSSLWLRSTLIFVSLVFFCRSTPLTFSKVGVGFPLLSCLSVCCRHRRSHPENPLFLVRLWFFFAFQSFLSRYVQTFRPHSGRFFSLAKLEEPCFLNLFEFPFSSL